MSRAMRVACVQTCATPDVPANLAQAYGLIEKAAGQGAQLVALPEAFDCLVPTATEMHDYARQEADHLALNMLRQLAGQLRIWLLAGSVSARSVDGAVANRSVLIAPDGDVAARYDKVHLFDVDLPDGTSARESDFYRAGTTGVVAQAPWGRLGMSICYDVRFPGLYRSLAGAGAEIIAVPAAFSSMTGPLHWEALLRARAIETGSFVIAPAQCGHHYGERWSHGHSMIIDPWGRILAQAGSQVDVIMADIDLEEVYRFRSAIPSLANGRAITMGEVAA
ncbi:carbon-nitrogen hydrolase family protein [Sphingobium aquiterrae]|uniref:carbon-nitrogen hydrolase family protein n=1 Tax=Sphingobium aquiterrae TaxID=2038656 RepID=UPI00301690AA